MNGDYHMSTRIFSDVEKHKIKQIIHEGINVTSEIETLKGGLNDTVKALATELDIKPSIIKKAIRVAYKSQLDQQREDFNELEAVLETAGKS
jgi:hypothetical protein